MAQMPGGGWVQGAVQRMLEGRGEAGGESGSRARVWRAGQTVKVIKGWGKMPNEPWEYRTVLMFEPRDCWVGLYWDRLFIYVCALPCLPLRIQYRHSWS